MLRERPGGEVDVGVVEAREDAASAQVDGLGRRKRGLVRPDPADDPLARDRQRPREWQGRIQGPDHPVLEEHDRRS